MAEFIECPDEGCDQAAEVVERYWLDSTFGPVVHIRTRCIINHHFNMPEV